MAVVTQVHNFTSIGVSELQPRVGSQIEPPGASWQSVEGNEFSTRLNSSIDMFSRRVAFTVLTAALAVELQLLLLLLLQLLVVILLILLFLLFTGVGGVAVTAG